MATLKNRWKWTAFALLSIAVPMGLLATFRMTGLLQEQPPPKTVTVEMVTWNMSRPLDYIAIDEKVEGFYGDDVASVGFGVHISSYWENEPALGDYVMFVIAVSANITDGFISSVVINFSEIDADAFLDIIADLKDPEWVELHNLDIVAVRDSGRTHEPYIHAIGVNHPKYCSLKMIAFWMFLDKNNQNHWITAASEVTYFNGNTYQKVTIPIRLGVLVDSLLKPFQ